MRNVLILLAGCSILAGCGSTGPYGPLQTTSGPTSNVQLVYGTQLPPPTEVDLFRGYRPYRIGPFDRLEISVFGVEDLQRREYRADASGRVSFPLAGTVEAAGLTPAELEQEIANRLRGRFIRDPQVTVNLAETVSQVVTVSGQVVQPGLYPVVGKMTLQQAVATARGMDDFAKVTEVIVFRDVGGQKMAAIYDLRGIERGNYDDPEIYANDIVVVGDSPQRRLMRDLIGAAPAILAPLLVTII